MKNKNIIIAAIILIVIVAGVIYSFSYEKNRGQEILLSSIDNKEDDLLNVEIHDNSLNTEDGMQEQSKLQNSGLQEESHESIIYVHICGAVVNPNVYQVKAGTRLVELIDYAGGLIPEAADDYINQALAVEDGQRIYIPTREELKELSLDEYVIGDNIAQSDTGSEKKIDINTANEAELMTLPGIGSARAKGIIEYRAKNGDFKDITDLMNVSGIKEGMFAQLEDMIIVK